MYPGRKHPRFSLFHSGVCVNFLHLFPITYPPRQCAGTFHHPNPLQLNQLSQSPHSCRTPRIGSSGHLLFSAPANMQAGVRHHNFPCSEPLSPRQCKRRHGQKGEFIRSSPSSLHLSEERIETKTNLSATTEANPERINLTSSVAEYNSSLRHSNTNFTQTVRMRKVRGSWCTAAHIYKGVSGACAA